MTVAYKQKIVQAFRDNAIRSVLLIDDEYQPYETLVKNRANLDRKLNDLVNSDITDLTKYKERLVNILQGEEVHTDNKVESFLRRSDTAQQFVEFFHSKKRICTVESDVSQLEVEKIRKSDLVILDYHLNPEDKGNEAKYSLKLISDLSTNKHMNIVVVYTNEELESVWQQIASVLHGDRSNSIAFQDEELAAWEEYALDWEKEWENAVFKKSMIHKYLLGDLDLDALLTEMKSCLDEEIRESLQVSHIQKLIEISLLKLNTIKANKSNFVLHGTKGKWIQAGYVFIALKSKEVEDKPSEVWDCIQDSLCDWKPSFYRVITSELQNQIEDANLSMEKVLSKEKMEQISMLWGVLRVEENSRNDAAKVMLGNLLHDVSENIRNDSTLIKFVVDSVNNTSEELPKFIDFKENYVKHSNFINKMLDIAAENYEVGIAGNIDTDFRCNVVHAFNEQLCTVKEDVSHISTGVIIKDIDEGSYYLCIAPSCNTVPNQTTGGSLAKAMTPHRAMRFIKLKIEDNLKKALKTAHQSDTIFISDKDRRLALKVYETEGTPAIDQGFVVNHDDEKISIGSTKRIKFVITNSEKELEIVEKEFLPIAKLRAGFASRYQNTQLQYEARIGVDFISAVIT
ncbi:MULTISPECIES: response regulator receiver domain [unclassified Psychrobacter]|uniref:response regulator receiver domain n=1 Tax=unclassified Psychrobacter TaxID=196806 RepID=UPI000429CC45|nr:MULTISPECIES: response regulator receiver domain [unclassified Psychrobacter]